MLRSENMKLYRKLLILAVLLGGLFIMPSLGKVSAAATFCCSECDIPHGECVADCYANQSGSLPQLQQCLHVCHTLYYFCMQGDVCDPGC
jgi:hypothetical protein